MEVRIDKYLFAMRLYKTRAIATDACKCGHVKLLTAQGETELKPARTLKIGDRFSVRKGPITYRYEVLQLSENRLGAKLVPEYLRDITPEEEKQKMQMILLASQSGRDRGTGRPTKKDRRDILSFMEDTYGEDE